MAIKSTFCGVVLTGEDAYQFDKQARSKALGPQAATESCKEGIEIWREMQRNGFAVLGHLVPDASGKRRLVKASVCTL